MTPQQFGQSIKQKYPQYSEVDDVVLADMVIKKYPQYQSQIAKPVEQTPSVLEKTGDVLDTIFGGGKVGAKIGEHIAKGTFGDTVQKAVIGRDLSSEEEAAVTSDVTGKQVAGDIVRAGSIFLPFGKMAQGAGAGLQALGASTKVAQTVAPVIAGGAIGATADAGFSMAEGGEPKLGLGTVVGAGIPAISPIAKGIARFTGRFGGKVGSEIQGALTGTSAETIEQAFMAGKKGGKELETFTKAMRGETTPEQLVNTLRENIGTVSAQRQQAFRDTLSEFGDVVLDTAPAKTGFVAKLQEAGIAVGENGALDFSNSKLRLVPQAQAKLQTAFADLMNTPAQATLVDIDTTRQAIKALSLAGDDPSANLANKLLDDAVRGVRRVGEQVPEYGTMLKQFSETSEFLDEIQRGLSTGDRATVDQTYRRMATALKTNNEARLALIQELDQATDGAVLSSIAGQQLSEAMPRGIFRQIAAGMAGGALVMGGGFSPIVSSLVFTSPRVAGEFVRSLGIASAKADEVIKAIAQAREVLIKGGIISATISNPSDDE
jgi:hypothetical protein